MTKKWPLNAIVLHSCVNTVVFSKVTENRRSCMWRSPASADGSTLGWLSLAVLRKRPGPTSAAVLNGSTAGSIQQVMSTWRWTMRLRRHLQPDARRTLRMESLKPHFSATWEEARTNPPMVPLLAPFSIYFRLQKKAPPTRTERLGHQPRQAAGNLGSGKVVMVEALDGGDDEGPSHPAVIICRVSHLQALCSWRFTQPREFLLTADDIPHGGIQRSRGKKIPLLEPQKKKIIKVWQRLGDCEHDGSEKQQVPA